MTQFSAERRFSMLGDAASEMTLAYEREVLRFGEDNGVLSVLRPAIGDLAAVRASVLDTTDAYETRLSALAEAAERMRVAYNAALERFGGYDQVLGDLRWAIGHLAVTREVVLDPSSLDTFAPHEP